MTAYGRGRHAEYLARNRLWRQGFIVFRTAGSHGEVDLIAVTQTQIRCVQVKSTRGRALRRDGKVAHVTPAERLALAKLKRMLPPYCTVEIWMLSGGEWIEEQIDG